MAQLDSGQLVVTDAIGARVLSVDPATGAQTVLASGGSLVEPRSAVVDPDSGLVYVADREAGTRGAVIAIDPAAYDGGNPEANQTVIATA